MDDQEVRINGVVREDHFWNAVEPNQWKAFKRGASLVGH
jgi:hypothetical protein